MRVAVSTAVSVPMKFLDATNTGKTGLTVVATARLAGTTTTVAGTVTERTGGEYDAAITFPTVGTWLFQGNTTVDGDPALWPETIQVVTAAKDDPAASITALYGALLANLDAAVSTRLAAASAATPLANLDAAISSRSTTASVAALLGNLDAAVSSRATVAAITSALSAATVTVSSPVATTGDVTVYQGDDQQAADSRSLDWASTSWPDLTSATIALAGQYGANPALVMSATGSVTTPTGSSKAVRVELTHTQTAALKTGKWNIQVIATLASGHVVTLVGGTDDDPVTMTVVDRVGA